MFQVREIHKIGNVASHIIVHFTVSNSLCCCSCSVHHALLH